MPRSFRGTWVGTDYLGNKYYEITGGNQKKRRWFEPKEKDDFEQELPTEWESWLRGRRKEPPQEEEINKNLEIMRMKQKNADELNKKYLPNSQNTTLEEEKKGLSSFPKYNEYEITPGKKQK